MISWLICSLVPLDIPMPPSIPPSPPLDTVGISSPAGGLAPLVPREPGGLREAFIPVWQCRIGNSVHCQVKRCSQRKDKWLKENVGLVFKTATAWVPSSCRLTFPRPHGMLVNTSTARLSSTFSPWTVISMRCTVKTQGFLKSYNHKNHCY